MRPRDLVISHLKTAGEVSDPGGLASAALAEAVGYPGSSVAFAQLLSGMERSGLIEREIRGRRTYRIALAPATAAPARDQASAAGVRPASPAAASAPKAGRPARGGSGAQGLGPAPGAVGLDYDEMARRLLVEVVRLIGTADGRDDHARTVASLERKLAAVEARQRRLREENTKLRELLAAARQSLAEQQSRIAIAEPGAYLSRLDTGAVQLLERLLVSLRGEAASEQGAQVG